MVGPAALALLLTSAALLCAAPALAQDEAREAFTRGQAAYDRGDYNAAIVEWQHSFELSQKVSLLYNIALAYERVGRLEEAAASLERFVAGTEPSDPHLDRARARLAQIKERLAETGVVIACSEEGATILIDDQDRGRTPRPDRIALPPGGHRVIVRKEGFQDFRSDVALAAGQELRVDVSLTPAPSGGSEAALAAAEASSAPEPGGGGSSSMLGPVLTIGGGAVAATGLVIGAIALSNAEDASSEKDADGARTLALVADISLGVGVVAAAVGTYLWLSAGGEAEPASAGVSSFDLRLERDRAWLGARGRF